MKKFLPLILTLIVISTGNLFAQSVVISPAGTVTTTVGQTVNFTSTISGFSSGSKTYDWQVSPNVSFTDGSNTADITFSATGTYTVKLKVTRNSQTATSTTTTVIVNPALTANAGADQTITLPVASVTLNGSATGGTAGLTYGWSKVSGTGSSITSPNSASTTVTGLSAGSYTFRLTVTDNSQPVQTVKTDDIIITVNSAPSVSLSPSATQNILAAASVNFTATPSNFPGSGSYTYTWAVSPTGGVSIPAGSTSPKNITFSTAGAYTVQVTATRGSGAATSPATIVNVYTVNAGSDQAILLPTTTAALSGSFAGPAGAAVTWTKQSGSASGGAIADATSASTTVSGLVAGTYTYRLTINGTSFYDEVTITVTTPPTVTLSPSIVQTIVAGGSVSLTASTADFPGSGSYTYTWTASPTGGVSIPSGNSSSKTITFNTAGTYTVQAAATRSSATGTSPTVTVVVINSSKSYSDPIYSANIRGGHTMFGNTMMAIYNNDNTTINTTAMNDYSSYSQDANGNTATGVTSQYSNDNSNMRFVNIDGASVTNASSADLILPASGTNTIKFARLYWGGFIQNSDITGDGNTPAANLRNIKIRKGASGSYTSMSAAFTQVNAVSLGSTMAYQSYIDVTNFIQANGAGTYTIANIAASQGPFGSGGSFAGWGIVVGYENSAQTDYYSVRIYDALLHVSNSTSQTVTLTGFNGPNNTLTASEAYLSTFAWEGDASLAATTGNPAGDFLKINGITYSDAVNPATNMWNGTISNNGAHVTTKSPNYKNQMGIDIDQIQVGSGYGINPNATSVQVMFGTEADQYFPSVFAFSLKMKDPVMTITKTIGGNPATIIANQKLTYIISGSNTGSGNANPTVIVDSLPEGITYIPGSLQIIKSAFGTIDNLEKGVTGFQTDATNDDNAFYTAPNPVTGRKAYITFYVGKNATNTAGGILAPNDQYEVRLLATTPFDANSLTSVTNIAYVTTTTQLLGDITNEASVSIGPANSPLSIKLGSFTVTKSGSDALLQWTTLTEKRNDRMEIERSIDGIHFVKVGSVDGSGTSNLVHNYQFNDPLNGLSGIVYYRLRDVDIDGKGTYSKIVVLRLDGSMLKGFSVYPNPFVSDIKVNVYSTKEMKAGTRITNTLGQVIANRSITLQPGTNTLVLTNLDGMVRGTYVLELITEEGKSETQTIIKK